jgi:hypothetical protein
MNKLMIAVVCVALGATSVELLAQSGSIRLVPPPTGGVRFAQPWRAAGIGGDTKIIGTVIDIRQVPVAHVKVQLRSLVTGVVEKQGESDENGEYNFPVDDPGTYVVEMVMADGYVVALSNAGSLARYETLRTLVQLPGRWDTQIRNMVIAQDPSSFFGMSAQTTMTASTMTIAVDMNIAPTNSGEPVSASVTVSQ